MSRHLTFFLLLSVGCSQVGVERAAESPEAAGSAVGSGEASVAAHRIDAEHLPNAVQVHAKVISGGLPEGDAAFGELQSLGVKTVISVDGMKPDVATARKYGLRYVHLPHGYDGVPAARVQELAKAVRELEGPIYIHCHHGKHRSPAAASVACVGAGLIPQAAGVAILELAGTSTNYRGLYESARNAKPLEAALLDALEVEFPESAEVPPMAEAMVAIGHTHDHLQLIAESGWRSPADHPDLDPAHEALLLREHFTELLRTESVRREPEEFQTYLRESEEAAKALEEALHTWSATAEEPDPPESVRMYSGTISANCKACHALYRDVPLGEK